MIMIIRSQVNMQDSASVLLGKVHNIGAGGVLRSGKIASSPISLKRFMQYTKRTNRAYGFTE